MIENVLKSVKNLEWERWKAPEGEEIYQRAERESRKSVKGWPPEGELTSNICTSFPEARE